MATVTVCDRCGTISNVERVVLSPAGIGKPKPKPRSEGISFVERGAELCKACVDLLAWAWTG